MFNKTMFGKTKHHDVTIILWKVKNNFFQIPELFSIQKNFGLGSKKKNSMCNLFESGWVFKFNTENYLWKFCLIRIGNAVVKFVYFKCYPDLDIIIFMSFCSIFIFYLMLEGREGESWQKRFSGGIFSMAFISRNFSWYRTCH